MITHAPGYPAPSDTEPTPEPSRIVDITERVLSTPGAGVQARRRGDNFTRMPIDILAELP